MDWAIKILGALGGLIGTGLGVYNFVHARRQERRARASEEKDWQIYVALRAEIGRTGGNAYMPDEGSEEHRWAERMVAKGLLDRGTGGIYYTMGRGA
jgi:hypothetical protein